MLGKATILVPSPNVAGDHQTHNAMALVNKQAAVLVKDIDAEKELIAKALQLIFDETKLAQLSQNSLKLAEKDSARRIAEEVIKLANLRK